MRRVTFVVLAAIWANTVITSGQSSVPAVYRLLEMLRSRATSPRAEASRPQPPIPRTWEDQAVASLQLPLAVSEASPVHVPSTYYYGIPIRPVYKSYAVYHPSREPLGYIDWLKRQEPQVVFDAAKLQTPADWIAAGEVVFDAPIAYGHLAGFGSDLYLRDADWYRDTRAPLAADGTLPFFRYVVRSKGKVEIGIFRAGCAIPV